jgi:hypothetical protein
MMTNFINEAVKEYKERYGTWKPMQVNFDGTNSSVMMGQEFEAFLRTKLTEAFEHCLNRLTLEKKLEKEIYQVIDAGTGAYLGERCKTNKSHVVRNETIDELEAIKEAIRREIGDKDE